MLTISLLLLSPVITVGSPQGVKNPNKIVCQLEFGHRDTNSATGLPDRGPMGRDCRAEQILDGKRPEQIFWKGAVGLSALGEVAKTLTRLAFLCMGATRN